MKDFQNRGWRSSPEISTELQGSPILKNIQEAAELQDFLSGALPINGYKANPQWEQIVTLTPAGKWALQIANIAPSSELNNSDIMMAMFSVFFHHDFLIDCVKCDLNAIRQVIEKDLLSEKLKWPNEFGRTLYDKFNDDLNKGDRTDHLLPDEALTLLNGTEQGVFQVGKLVLGPLGLIQVSHARYFPTNRNPILWHCSDPGCQAPHRAHLLPSEVPMIKTVRNIHEALKRELGPASELVSALDDFLGRNTSRQPYIYFDVCILIGDCIFGEERISLLCAALAGRSAHYLREALGKCSQKKSALRGSPEAIARGLSPEEQLQLLFLLTDADLITLIDQCVERRSIRVPTCEVRIAKRASSNFAARKPLKLSSLGLRSTGGEPLVDFCTLLWDAYSVSSTISDLDWRLHNRLGSNTQNVLLDYLSKNPPASAVKELILASEPITKHICETLKCAIEDVNNIRFVDRLLWKLGFDLPRFSETLELLKRRLESFNQELLAIGALREERDRERIRSAGVNLFVSVEEFLEEIVSFNVWLLSSDHFLETEFRFDSRIARKKVGEVLGLTVNSGDIEVAWNPNKANTLGVSMAYLNAAVTWMMKLLGFPREPLMRPEADMPDFSKNKSRIFPFRHTALWADCDFGSLERLVEGLSNIVSKIARSNLASIRNGLDHQRDDSEFPKIDQMLAFVAHFREAVDYADINRFYPKEFWLEEVKQDCFGRQEYKLRDYSGRIHMFFGPSLVHGITSAYYNAPMIIAPGNLLGYANAEILIDLQETSIYSEYWKGYPRRRKIPTMDKSVENLQMQELTNADATNSASE